MIQIKELNPAEAAGYLDSGALLIDVREQDEIARMAFDVKAHENIPYSTFDENYDGIRHDTPVILACQHGIRSLRAAQFLVVQGWDEGQVFSLRGGIEAWKRDKQPVKLAPRTFTMAKPKETGCCGDDSNGPCC